ncbi:MAG: carbamoyl-phosphate synthase large subunit [Vulcanimicrobiota bacterium]
MPKRTDLRKILVLGSGGITIGQACEFDYSGTQALKALRQEGYEVVLVNSNPATIMTDPEMADRTYIEPLRPKILDKILERERPDAILPTVGGQTALNLAMELEQEGLLEKYSVEMIGATTEAIALAEDREGFRLAMLEEGLDVPHSRTCFTLEECLEFGDGQGYPVILRPSYTLGGTGGGIAYSREEMQTLGARALRASPVGSVLVEEFIGGWKEYELEVMRDRADNFVVICSIENIDPMGVHTGDSITVAPAMTLTDKEYQQMREWGRRVIRKVGVETGGSNVQFAVHPDTGRMVVIEMNPRVSRSSALASKATGFPIAKIAAKLAVGYTLDEIPNDITKKTPASFEPVLDYVVVKIPRWDFAKFPGADQILGPQMKSVGEVMAIGRTFAEALQKGLRSLELGMDGFSPGAEPMARLDQPRAERIFAIGDALRAGQTVEQLHEETGMDPWFLRQFWRIIQTEQAVSATTLDQVDEPLLRKAKEQGFSDRQLGRLLGCAALEVRARRRQLGVLPVFLRVDTCAAEFEAFTPYMYSSYESSDETEATDREKVIILGSGPNRIGQGIEFDYCCVHASWALAEMGYETIMINCNPETVSTDYDTSDRLYFEPLTLEDVLNVIEAEIGHAWDPDRQHLIKGVLVQFGGQTPLKLAQELELLKIPILGTQPDVIDLAEDRERFGKLLDYLEIPQPANGIARSSAEAVKVAEAIGFPVLVRPSYVLGGRAMALLHTRAELEQYIGHALVASEEKPVLIDRFLEDAFEVDADAICDGQRVVIGGILQHIEEAGIHSGDSACVLPPYKVSHYHLSIIREYVVALGQALGVIGLMNVQLAIKDDVVYVLEVNPRASRTVPFVAKATGVPLARLAAQVMGGKSLEELGFVREPEVHGFFVKAPVLPFSKFPGFDALLGPEMRSTGEVMGQSDLFGHAYAKAAAAAGGVLPLEGGVLITVNDYDKSTVLKFARDLVRMGFRLYGTHGTADFMARTGLPIERVNKYSQGSPHCVDLLRSGDVSLVINTPLGSESHIDGRAIRAASIELGIPLLTTTSAAAAAVRGIQTVRDEKVEVRCLQELQEQTVVGRR